MVLVVDQRIDDRFLDRLHGGVEDRIKAVVRHGLDCLRRLFGIGRAGVGGREGEEQVARAVAGNAAGAGQAETGAAREAFQVDRAAAARRSRPR